MLNKFTLFEKMLTTLRSLSSDYFSSFSDTKDFVETGPLAHLKPAGTNYF